MANLFIQDDHLLIRLQQISAREQRPVEAVLQSLLDEYESENATLLQAAESSSSLNEMLRLIQDEPFIFAQSFDAAEADDILDAELADILMKRIQGSDGA